jgi:hypothetical protein
LLNRINAEYQAKLELPDELTRFDQPASGEFEKSEDYAQRVEQLRREHEQRVVEQRRTLVASKTEFFSATWNTSLGSPELRELQYDADAEIFRAQIGSAAGLSIPITIPVPISEAEKLKATLAAMRPWVLHHLQGDQLVPVTAILQDSERTVDARLERTVIDFPFSAAQLQAYRGEEALRARAEAEDRDARRAETAQRYPYVATFRCSINGQPMPFSACLRTDGRVEIRTTEGVHIFMLPDFAASTSYQSDLTRAFQAAAQVGTGSRFGQIEIDVTDRLSGRTLGSAVASGAGDYAILRN